MADHGDDAGGQDDDGREGKVDVKQGTGEVISAVGAWVVVFRKPRLRRQNGGGGSGNSNIQEKGGGGGGKKETEDLVSSEHPCVRALARLAIVYLGRQIASLHFDAAVFHLKTTKHGFISKCISFALTKHLEGHNPCISHHHS